MNKMINTTFHKGVEVQLCAYDYVCESIVRAWLADPIEHENMEQLRDSDGRAVDGCYLTIPTINE